MRPEIKYLTWDAAADPALVDQKKFNWLEYYKVKFKADWYTKIYGKLVLRTLTEFGFWAHIISRGVPFERCGRRRIS
jgi:outer membrane protein insertion porin family